MIILNDEEVRFIKFPNGETLVPEIEGDVMNIIDFKYEDDSELIKLMFVKNHLDKTHHTYAMLRIYYMPYSRMDRSEGNSVFTLKYIANFINNLNFDAVLVVEPHSDVTLALLDRAKAVYPTFKLLNRVEDITKFDSEKDFLFFPDAGAQKRYSKLTGYNQLVGYKKRDFKTGKIKSLEVVGAENLEGELDEVIIVDDLTSYGTTFIESAAKLRAFGFKRVYLLVGHAENSIFKPHPVTERKLLDHIDGLFCTDSILSDHKANWFTAKNEDKLHVFEVRTLL